MDVEGRIRKQTEKGAEYSAQVQAKKNAALARIQAKKAMARNQAELDDLSALFTKVSVAQNDADVDAHDDHEGLHHRIVLIIVIIVLIMRPISVICIMIMTND